MRLAAVPGVILAWLAALFVWRPKNRRGPKRK